ncbi:MAG: ATP-dependent DNA helicase Rep [Oleiphilaceae bacterium]
MSLSRLNPKQREAVDYVGGPLLVLAGAGSGKTSVITRKIAYLIKTCGYKGKNIAALTFTNKASREMKERASKLVSGPDGRGLTVSTFHNLGLNIIRKEHKALGYKPGFSIFDGEDAKALIRDLMMKEGDENTDSLNHFQMEISNWKNAMLSPEHAVMRAKTPEDLVLANVYSVYNRYLKAYNALDFDDLILKPVELFNDHPEILSKWRLKIRYLLVDEYQDTNIAQYELVKLLVGDRGALTVVGDDDQSIYSWRGARPENLAQLETDFPTLKLIKLEQNYRSTSLILRSANKLIANNPHMFEKALWSELAAGERIRVVRCRNEDAESEQVAAEILDLKLKKNIPFKDFAVLYRGNHQARLLEIKLNAFQVPYRLSGGTSFFAKNEIKDAMAYLRLIANPDDDAAFLRVVNVPRREIGPSTLEKLGNYSTGREISLNKAIGEVGLEQTLIGKPLDRIRKFSEWLSRTTERCHQEDPISVIKQLFTDIEYDQWLYQNANTPKQAERRMENVWYLVESLNKMLEKDKGTADEIGVDDAVSKLMLRDMLEQQEEDDDSDKVHLLTLHASKGLEFPNVFIMGLEEEILPHRNSIEEDNIEEERRLMYVGITRAKQSLVLTYSAMRKQYGEKYDTIPSRFLDELPDDDLQWEGGDQQDKERAQEKGKSTMAALLGGLK